MSPSTGSRVTRGRIASAVILAVIAIAFLVVGVIFCVEPSGSLPFWLGGQISQMFVQAVQRQQQLYPESSPPPPADYVTTMNNMFNGFFWVVAIVGITISLVVVIGALQRWTWMHYAVIVLLGLSTLSLLLNIVNGLARSTYSFPVIVPSWVNVVLVAFGLGNAALFGWMLIALVQRGPWAMARSADN